MNEYVNLLKEANFEIVLVTNRVIRFHGEGWRALALVLQRQWPVQAFRRVWPIIDSEPTGPYWELEFYV